MLNKIQKPESFFFLSPIHVHDLMSTYYLKYCLMCYLIDSNNVNQCQSIMKN